MASVEMAIAAVTARRMAEQWIEMGVHDDDPVGVLAYAHRRFADPQAALAFAAAYLGAMGRSIASAEAAPH